MGDTAFHPLIQKYSERMLLLSDRGFHAKGGDPPNIKICEKGKWNERMVVETVLSMLTNVCYFKNMGQRAWKYLRARLAHTMAMFNVLVQWDGMYPDKHGFVPLTLAPFSL